VLRHTVDDETVLTYLYLYGGQLCEVSVLEGTTATKNSGQQVLPLQSFVLSLEKNDLLHVEISDQTGHSSNFLLFIRTAEVSP
jgi:hypothetical protein